LIGGSGDNVLRPDCRIPAPAAPDKFRPKFSTSLIISTIAILCAGTQRTFATERTAATEQEHARLLGGEILAVWSINGE